MLPRLRRRSAPPAAPFDTLEPAAAAIEALQPRMLLLFGVPRPASIPADCQVFEADQPAAGEPLSDTAVEEFFERKIKISHAIRPIRRPWYFDVAIIGPAVRLGLKRRILSGLKPTAHARSVVLVLRRPTTASRRRRSIRSGVSGLVRVFKGLETVGLETSPPGILISDLDIARQRARAGRRPLWLRVGFGADTIENFVERRRIGRLGAAEGQRIEGAPAYEAAVVEPPYREIGGDPGLFQEPGLDQRAASLWWGKPLRLLPLEVARFEGVSFIPADGLNRALLIDGLGRLVPASLRWEAGYGLDASSNVETPPGIVFASDGRRLPLPEAAGLRGGPKIAGDVFLLGFLDDRFGHFLVETLAAGWALPWATEQKLPLLVWGDLRSFHREALRLLGIEEDRLLFAQPGCVYERVHAPTPGFRMLGSVAPATGRTWNALAERAMAEAEDVGSPAPLVFLSRRGAKVRRLVNLEALEAHMEARGALIVRPETLPFAEQIRTVRRARAVAGCFGSQLHLSMFQPGGARKLVIGSEQFTGPDETLISIANGTEVDYYLQSAPRRGSRRARTAPWTIDMDRFVPAFDRWLAQAVAFD